MQRIAIYNQHIGRGTHRNPTQLQLQLKDADGYRHSTTGCFQVAEALRGSEVLRIGWGLFTNAEKHVGSHMLSHRMPPSLSNEDA